MKKIDRKKVFDKYNGHCAYCGRQIEYKDMQVDHITSKRNGRTDDIRSFGPLTKTMETMIRNVI